MRGVGVNWVKTINHTYDVALMRDLVTDLLESERLASPHVALHRESADVAALLAEVVAGLPDPQAVAATAAQGRRRLVLAIGVLLFLLLLDLLLTLLFLLLLELALALLIALFANQVAQGVEKGELRRTLAELLGHERHRGARVGPRIGRLERSGHGIYSHLQASARLHRDKATLRIHVHCDDAGDADHLAG